jgi:Transposase
VIRFSAVAKRHGVSTQTFRTWQQRFGGLQASDVRRLRQLETGERAADVGAAWLFLLLLTAAVELTLYSFFKFLKLIASSGPLNHDSGA